MTCSDYEALIGAMLDGELSEEEERALHTHLETCERCRNYYALLQALQGAPEADAPDPPADLAEKIMTSVRTAAAPAPQPKKKGRIFGLPSRALALAAAAAIVILAGWSGSRLFQAKGRVSSDHAAPGTAAAQASGEAGSPKNGLFEAAGERAEATNASASLFMDALTEDAEAGVAPAELPAEPADDACAGFQEFRSEDRGEPVPFTLWVGEEKRSSGPDCGFLEWRAALSSTALPAPEREPDYTLRDDEGNILWSLWEDEDDTLMVLRPRRDSIFFVSSENLWEALGVEP